MSGAVAKLIKDRQEKLKNYKAQFDVDRVLALAHAAHLLRDFPAHAALSSAIVKELTGLNLKQTEVNSKETEDDAKDLAAAQAEDSKVEEDKPNPTHAPSIRRG